MRRTLQRAGTAVAATAMAAGVASTGAAAQSDCQWYATQALRQQQLNLQLGCKLTGDAWHSDLKQHYSWCATVSPETWKTAAQTREQELSACRARLGK